MNRRILVTNQYLKFDTSATFGWLVFGLPKGRVAASVIVTDATGHSSIVALIDEQIVGGTSGNLGAGEDAVMPGGSVSVDLLAGGAEIGEEVLVKIVWSMTMASVDPGIGGSFGAVFSVDNFRLCDEQANSVMKSFRRASYSIESQDDIDALSLALLPPQDQIWIARERVATAETARELELAIASVSDQGDK